MWAYSPKNREKSQFLVFTPIRKFWGYPEKVEYRCTTTNYFPLCNDTVIILKITLLHNVSVIINFVIPMHDKKKQTKKQHTFSSTAGARPTIPIILGMVIEEVRPIFSPPFLIRSVVSPLGAIENLRENAPPRESAYILVVCPHCNIVNT